MKIRNPVKVWIAVGLVMLYFQIILGGITRLTGSGLSITKWEIVTGTLPPTSLKEWEKAFELYQNTPQYEKINRGMTMGEFQNIYFWEYIHRLWARLMGFVFTIPFLIFLMKRKLNRSLLLDLVIVILLASLAASLGWLMVVSGLEDRPWVNAYKLSLHLTVGISVFAYLLWTYLKHFMEKQRTVFHKKIFRISVVISFLLVIQIILGGLMSGMKASLLFPTWPEIGESIFPQELINIHNWSVYNFTHYDQSTFAPMAVQFLHRSTAYILIIIGIYIVYKIYIIYGVHFAKRKATMFISLLIIQILLGILTLIQSKGSIPLFLGIFHQGIAILLFGSSLYLNYILYTGRKKKRINLKE